MKITRFQIGKSGITEGVIESLELSFKHHKQVKISALKSSGRNRESIKEMAQKIVARLKEKKVNCNYTIIGFTIVLIKSSSN